MAIIGYRRKSETVRIGGQTGVDVVLYEGSAADRLRYAEILLETNKGLQDIESESEGKEGDMEFAKYIANKKQTFFLRAIQNSDVFLIAACIKYGFPDSDIEEIKNEVFSLPTEIVGELAKVARKLCGMEDKEEADEPEKK